MTDAEINAIIEKRAKVYRALFLINTPNTSTTEMFAAIRETGIECEAAFIDYNKSDIGPAWFEMVDALKQMSKTLVW